MKDHERLRTAGRRLCLAVRAVHAAAAHGRRHHAGSDPPGAADRVVGAGAAWGVRAGWDAGDAGAGVAGGLLGQWRVRIAPERVSVVGAADARTGPARG